MADVQLVIGDVAVNPDLVLDYADATYNDRIAEFETRFGGAIEILPPSEDVKPGTDVNAPTLKIVGAASRRDLTATGATNATAAPEGAQRRMPVLSSLVGPHKFTDAAVRGYKRTPEQVAAALGEQMAQRVIDYRKLRSYDAFRGAAAAATTVTHINTTGSAATLSDVLAAKEKLGDAASGLVTVIMHSKVWKSLLSDAGTGANINSDAFADMVFVQGGIPALVGMNIIIDDQISTVSVSGGTQYHTLLLGPGALKLAPAPRVPLFTAEVTISDGRAMKVVTEDHFAVGVAGMDYSGGQTNPTAANLYNSASWAEAFSHDHKDFNAAVLKKLFGAALLATALKMILSK